MRDILKKATSGAMIAGAALLVAACGGGASTADNTVTNDLGADATYDANAVDMGMDTNLTMDADLNAVDANAVDANVAEAAPAADANEAAPAE